MINKTTPYKDVILPTCRYLTFDVKSMENSAEALSLSLQLALFSSTNIHASLSNCIWCAEEDSPTLSFIELNNSGGDTPSKTVASLLLAESIVSRPVCGAA